jgi:hypothetical protein
MFILGADLVCVFGEMGVCYGFGCKVVMVMLVGNGVLQRLMVYGRCSECVGYSGLARRQMVFG